MGCCGVRPSRGPRGRRAPRGAGRSGHYPRRAGAERAGFSPLRGGHRGACRSFGPVYLDIPDDVYGLAANVAARVSRCAAGSVVVSDGVEPLIGGVFQLEHRAPAAVKGVDAPISHYRVVGECAAPPRVASTALLGRERELALLSQSWARAQAGTLAAGVVFGGEPGIGKSRVALAAGEMVHRDGAAVVELFGSPPLRACRAAPRADVAGAPVRHRSARRSRPAAYTAARRVGRTGPGSTDCRATAGAQVLGIGPQEGYQPAAVEGRKLQQMICEAVCGYLLACLGDGPGLVVVEDGRWLNRPPPRCSQRCCLPAAAGCSGLDHTRQRVAAARLAGDGVRSGAADRRTEPKSSSWPWTRR